MSTNHKTLRELDPPLAVEVLVYEVRADAYETWKAAEYEFWTKGLADRFPFFVDKQTWLRPGDEWHKVTIVISWASEDEWKSIDPDWLEEHERRFTEVVGADNVRFVGDGHTAEQFYKVSEYR